MGSHIGFGVDLGSHSGPAMSHITLDKFPDSSEPVSLDGLQRDASRFK